MGFPSHPNAWRVINVLTATVASNGGAANSTTTVGSETYAVEMVYPAMAGSTSGGVRYVIGTVAEIPVANSTTSALMAVNMPTIRKVTPGQKISVISNDAGVGTITIMELAK